MNKMKAMIQAHTDIRKEEYKWMVNLIGSGLQDDTYNYLYEVYKEIGIQPAEVTYLYHKYSPSFAGYPARWDVLIDTESRLVLESTRGEEEATRLVINKVVGRSTIWLKHPDNEQEWTKE